MLADSAPDLVIGLDEAGRGPMLGPMVLACVALRPRASAALTRAGVMDSKRFGAGAAAHAARMALLPRILAAASHAAVAVVDVAEIDRYTRRGGLNRLEQEHARRLLGRAPVARRIVADGARLFAPLRTEYPHLEALDRGEEQHVAVAAASVLAKARRDTLFGVIARRYRAEFGAISGGGYVNAGTRAFLLAYIERHGGPPPEARRSWPWTFAHPLLGADFDPFLGLPDAESDGAVQSAPPARTIPQLALGIP